MPTISTALAVESLFKHTTEECLSKKPSSPEIREAARELPAPAAERRASSHRFCYYPALYATPALAPIPDVSSIVLSPTTYVVNHKRRDARPCPAVACRVEDFEVRPKADVLNGDATALPGFLGGGKVEEEKLVGGAGDDEVMDADLLDDFLEPHVSINVGTSGSDAEDGGSLRPSKLGNQPLFSSPNQDEYYDTADEFFSDGSFSNSSPSFKRSIENELHILRLTLIEESSRRERAEENLLYLNKQYEKLLKCLSHSRLLFPELPNLESLNKEVDPTELYQEIVVLKLVSEALETDLAKDEVEEIFKGIIASKNHEISRLRDRMLYYEAMNREMSQRNQEIVDLARKRRLRRGRMCKWIWSCAGLFITAGASILAYSYLPHHHQDISSAAPCSNTSPVSTE